MPNAYSPVTHVVFLPEVLGLEIMRFSGEHEEGCDCPPGPPVYQIILTDLEDEETLTLDMPASAWISVASAVMRVALERDNETLIEMTDKVEKGMIEVEVPDFPDGSDAEDG